MTTADYLAAWASSIYLARLLPQPIRTFRTGTVAGVSALAAMNALIADSAWLAYGLSAHITVVWLVSIPAVATSAWTVILLRSAVDRLDVAAAVAWLGSVLGAALVGQLGAALAGTVIVTCGPQLSTVLRSSDLVGLSTATWWAAIADALTWGAYGFSIRNVAIESYGIVLLATAVTILAKQWSGASGQQSGLRSVGAR
jgi:uncharacterized protein with PQ loop repeat